MSHKMSVISFLKFLNLNAFQMEPIFFVGLGFYNLYPLLEIRIKTCETHSVLTLLENKCSP